MKKKHDNLAKFLKLAIDLDKITVNKLADYHWKGNKTAGTVIDVPNSTIIDVSKEEASKVFYDTKIVDITGKDKFKN
jgi:hypothetical protein